MFQYFRLQFCCLIIMFLLGAVYYFGTKRREKQKQVCNPIFDAMIFVGDFEILFDGISAVTVNFLDQVPRWLNLVIHGLFFLSLVTELFLYFIYMLVETDAYPRKNEKIKKVFLYAPFAFVVGGIICNLNQLNFLIGKKTNFSMGISVYFCFISIVVLILGTAVLFIKKWKFVSKRKRANILLFLGFMISFSLYQFLIPEALLTSAAILLLVIGVYLTQENPLYREIDDSTNEMVMGFATLVENRDDSTGGHIRRTSAYVDILAREMRKRKIHSDVLTADYISDLKQAAPLHDVGKISIPDSILQKPGRLTDEEFNVMRTHAKRGGEIIMETFGHTGDKAFSNLAYQVATYHHEKWNGCGYPEGLKEDEIPLGARIMAIADVFDAVTEKRCYKEALPLEESFRIIENGSGKDFDPQIVELFLDLKEEITKIHDQITTGNKN